MRRGGVENVILGAVSKGCRSGYAIKQLVDNATRFFWAASYGQIYPELHRLERDGLIVGTTDGTGGRARIEYALTDDGRARLREWLLDPDAGYELRDQGLLKLFFADGVERDEAVEVVRNMRADREQILMRLRAIEARGVATGFPAVALEYGIEHHEWMIDWCRRLERRLTGTAEEVAA
jgi:PadR family transcriptional regulator AphA